MAANSLVSKLKLKPGTRAALVGAPPDYLAELGPLPEGVRVSTRLEGKFDWVQLFVNSRAELDGVLPKLVSTLQPEGLLWIAFPKGSSGVQTDLTRDKGWDSLRSADLKWITLISVDATWSAFSLRPYRPGEQQQTFR